MKEVVSVIRSLGGQLEEEIVSRKYLRTLFPIYAIRVSAIQELRCVQGNTLTFEGIIGTHCIRTIQLWQLQSRQSWIYFQGQDDSEGH